MALKIAEAFVFRGPASLTETTDAALSRNRCSTKRDSCCNDATKEDRCATAKCVETNLLRSRPRPEGSPATLRGPFASLKPCKAEQHRHATKEPRPMSMPLRTLCPWSLDGVSGQLKLCAHAVRQSFIKPGTAHGCHLIQRPAMPLPCRPHATPATLAPQ